MGKNNEPKTLTNLINCIGFFENNVSSLYKEIAGKVWLPLISAMLLEISLDSQKHSIKLKSIAESLPKIGYESKDYAKTIGEISCTICRFRQEITEAACINEEDIVQLSSQLIALENTMSDEYKVFVQEETVQLISAELEKIYRVDVDDVRRIFAEILDDEENHKKTLTAIRGLVDWRENKKTENAPEVRFQNPDAWSAPASNT